MFCTSASAAAPLRAAALGTLRIQASAAMMTGSSGYSTTATRERTCSARRQVASIREKKRAMAGALSPPSSSARHIVPRTQHQQQQRQSSTTVASPPPPPAAPEQPLTWNTFLHLRRRRRYYNVGGSVLTSLSSTLLGVSFLSQQDIDAIGSQLYGLDPFMVLGLATVGFGVAGWLAGPVLGGLAFKIVNRGVGGRVMAEKEKEFFTRIRRHRVDPSSQSFSNPVPDYYGEKIGSVQQYRQWLKDQRAYNKKRQSFL
ncbi:MAG: TIM23 complex component [Geoglossum umbratile]|nr:MAG: TIM23 complex component [Geoglossum umbratile]